MYSSKNELLFKAFSIVISQKCSGLVLDHPRARLCKKKLHSYTICFSCFSSYEIRAWSCWRYSTSTRMLSVV